jgi:hypothetical protein
MKDVESLLELMLSEEKCLLLRMVYFEPKSPVIGQNRIGRDFRDGALPQNT